MRRDCGAAFSITEQDGTERLVIVQEVERTRRQDLDVDAIARTVREAVTTAHDIAVHAIEALSLARYEPAQDHQR